jgi:hypothetical protein
MSKRKRRQQPESGEETRPKEERTRNYHVQRNRRWLQSSIPQRVLLRRVFFINDNKTKYVSVAYYPYRNYEPLAAFGGANKTPITLTDQNT